jgi:hypothetical protein
VAVNAIRQGIVAQAVKMAQIGLGDKVRFNQDGAEIIGTVCNIETANNFMGISSMFYEIEDEHRKYIAYRENLTRITKAEFKKATRKKAEKKYIANPASKKGYSHDQDDLVMQCTRGLDIHLLIKKTVLCLNHCNEPTTEKEFVKKYSHIRPTRIRAGLIKILRRLVKEYELNELPVWRGD